MTCGSHGGGSTMQYIYIPIIYSSDNPRDDSSGDFSILS
jgi:hypothetical protein